MGRVVRRSRMQQIVDYAHRVFNERGHTPSYSMIQAEFGIEHAGTVRRYVKQAEAAGLVTLGEYSSGRGERVQRIRLGRPEEADTVRIKRGREL